MHPRIAERRAWVSYERDLNPEIQTMPTARKTRAVYTVQFGSTDMQGRASDPIECKDASTAARLAANVCFVFGAPSDLYTDDNWLLRGERDSLDWKSSTQFVRLTRSYPNARS
jgi:hypothetical protein